MKEVYDCIVVGSGCSGAIAAETLVDAGVSVTMLDVGAISPKESLFPQNKSFFDTRTQDDEQFKYLIGDRGQGIAWGKISKGAQLTPPRQYIAALVNTFLPLVSKTFSPLESLGYGGLGIGWGLQCWEYSDSDLKKAGLDPIRIRAAYEVVSQRIGVSATNDAAAQYTINNLHSFQPSATPDKNHSYIIKRYEKLRKTFQQQGFYVGRTPLALITKKMRDRKAYRYLDTDFYSDGDKSAWRPWIAVDELKKRENFTYKDAVLVTSFEENAAGQVIVHAINTQTNHPISFTCKQLILASGALGTARIALRSVGKDHQKVPLLSNPHTYVPCLQPRMLGKGYEQKKLGFGQLSYFIDPDGNDDGISVASSYSYQSLMLFRIITQIPLNFADGRIISQFLTSALVIMIIQHPDSSSSKKYLQLEKDPTSPTGDRLIANYELSASDEQEWAAREKRYVAMMRKLRTYPLKRVKTEHGSAIHYAGTLPFSKQSQPLHLNENGRIHQTRNVYVADSSGFTFLPAKGLTFTLMANAHIVAQNILKERK